jgi:hypothetical protein
VSVAKFRIKAQKSGQFNGADEATVEIDRGSQTITIRPLRQRTTFILPLADVAESIIWRHVRADARGK